MSQQPLDATSELSDSARLPSLLLNIPPGRRGALLQAAVSFRPGQTLDQSFDIGPIRAAFADYWEYSFNELVPMRDLQAVLEPPIPIKTVLEFTKFMLVRDQSEAASRCIDLLRHLREQIDQLRRASQLRLFHSPPGIARNNGNLSSGHIGTVATLDELIERGCTFPTIYADPPWPYQNQASRAAAANHYDTMSLNAICAEPVSALAAENAHLHLWTTNGFLREAFDVVDAWGFAFKSCLVWVKHELGMGNYWRVSHEFLLLGVRGNLKFHDRTMPSWLQASRTIHSRKPAVVRTLIEKVSPGPYLELYGREELPQSAWTVYGNQIERRLF